MSASENRKDELAARALSRLPDPPLPQGLAARIAARATAVPQIGTIAPANPVSATPPPVETVSRIEPARVGWRRWPVYAAASIAAVMLIFVGAFAGMGYREGRAPALAEKELEAPRPQLEQPAASTEIVEAATRAPVNRNAARKTSPAAPNSGLPLPATEAPTEAASDEGPAEAETPANEIGRPERLAQTEPKPSPQDTKQGGAVSIPVYGPPAPSGLGITGTARGGSTLPGEPSTESRPPRTGPPGSPPGSLPGPSIPRGPGPRP